MRTSRHSANLGGRLALCAALVATFASTNACESCDGPAHPAAPDAAVPRAGRREAGINDPSGEDASRPPLPSDGDDDASRPPLPSEGEGRGEDAGQSKDAGLDGAVVSFADPLPMGLRGGGSFFEVPDADLRERLATQPLGQIVRGHGGRSVAFKLTLADGTQGYYKPEQTFSAAHWWAEVAAYHLDRALGLHRVPPVVSRRLPWAPLHASAPGDDRFAEVIVAGDGNVRGCFSYWVPDHLTSMRFGRGWERWVRVQTWPDGAVSPFQRPRVYMEMLAAQRAAASGDVDAAVAELAPVEPTTTDLAANERNDEGTVLPAAPSVPDDAERAAELSDLVVFDYLTQNTDRWGGGNANVLTRGAGGRVVFLDNAAGFPDTVSATTALMDARLRVVQRFRRRTIDALRALDVQALARRMASEPLAPILDARQLANLDERRNTILAHVAAMRARFGDAVFSW